MVVAGMRDDGGVSQRKKDNSEAQPKENPKAQRAWRRQRLLADVFGDVLPDTTSDEHTAGARRDSDSRHGDRHYHDNRPPHHDKDFTA